MGYSTSNIKHREYTKKYYQDNKECLNAKQNTPENKKRKHDLYKERYDRRMKQLNNYLKYGF